MLNLVGPVPVVMTKEALLDWWTAVNPVQVQVKLFQNNLTPSPGSVIADFVEATFSGYAAVIQPIANWPVFQIMPDGSAIAICNMTSTFFDTNIAIPNTIYGLFVTDQAGTGLIGSIRFDTAKIMDGPTKFITIEVAITMPAASPAMSADVTSNG